MPALPSHRPWSLHRRSANSDWKKRNFHFNARSEILNAACHVIIDFSLSQVFGIFSLHISKSDYKIQKSFLKGTQADLMSHSAVEQGKAFLAENSSLSSLFHFTRRLCISVADSNLHLICMKFLHCFKEMAY